MNCFTGSPNYLTCFGNFFQKNAWVISLKNGLDEVLRKVAPDSQKDCGIFPPKAIA
jgi:hypothetical protein